MPPNMFAALKHLGFARFLSARFLATLSVQMQSVAIGWQVYAITKDPLDLGLIGLAQFAPFVFLILLAGQAADHWNRKWIVVGCFAVEVSCAFALLVLSFIGIGVIWPVLAVLVVFGAARAFLMPASQAITPNLVPPGLLPNAIALSSTAQHTATLGGPAVGGLLYVAGPEVVYTTVAGFLLIAIVLMIGVRVPQMIRATEPMTWATVSAGLQFVRGKPVILGAISLDLFAVLFGGATALLPAFAADVLHTGPEGLGLLRSAPAAGAAATAIVLAHLPLNRHVGRFMFAGVAAFGIATIVFGLSSNFLLSFAALVVLGAADMISVFVRQILIQLSTPDGIRGRVSAVNAVFIGASNELGEFESGVTAAWWGIVPAVVVGGVATLVVTATWMCLFPALRQMDRFPDPEPTDRSS